MIIGEKSCCLLLLYPNT